MRKFIIHILPLIFMLFLVTGCPYTDTVFHVFPQELSVEGQYTHPGAKVVFPEQIGQFRREKVIRYEPSEMNVSVGYNLYDSFLPIAVTIYVYPSSDAILSGSKLDKKDTSSSIMLEKHFHEVIEATSNAHPGAALISKEPIYLDQAGNIYKGWKGVLEYRGLFASKEQNLRSFVYVFDYDGWFVKYRITGPKKTSGFAIKHVDNFMNQFKW